MRQILNTRARHTDLLSPNELRCEDDATANEIEQISELVHGTRIGVENIILKRDSRMLLVVGPCSVHNPLEAIEYAKLLAPVARKVSETLLVIMRVYFDKPRTSIGWKGLIYDPDLSGITNIAMGLRTIRKLLLEVNKLGLAAGSEFACPLAPIYVADLSSWAAIGARTSESQTHREMSSGLSMPVGIKNSTSGSLSSAINAMIAARHPQGFFGVDQDGKTVQVDTDGNLSHLILRGGKRPNYGSDSIDYASERLAKKNLPETIMVDCSHGNSQSQPQKQVKICHDVVGQRIAGNDNIIGLMIESNMFEGSQKITPNPKDLKPGVSITDGCIGWETTEKLILKIHERLRPIVTRDLESIITARLAA